MGMRNDSCMTYLDAVVSRQPGGGRCCSSGMSHGFSKEASRCRIEEALDIGLYQIAISSVLQIEGEVADRLQRTASGSVAVTALQKILLIDGRQQLRTGQLHQFIFERRYS